MLCHVMSCFYVMSNIFTTLHTMLYRQLSEVGVNTVRVPVGDWMYKPYEPFIGCWDGAVEVIICLPISYRYNKHHPFDDNVIHGYY